MAEIDKLTAQGWSLDPQLCLSLFAKREDPHDTLLTTLLNTDIKEYGAPCLPTEINRLDSTKLNGPHVLQVSAITDVSQPTRFQDITNSKRMLRLSLTDGKTKCMAIEYQPLDRIKKEDLIPGSKVKLKDCVIRLGVVLLNSKNIEVVGGRVEHLAETYEVQERVGGTAEREAAISGTAGGGDGTSAAAGVEKVLPPPKFQPYDAKKDRQAQLQKKHDKKQQPGGALPPPPPPGLVGQSGGTIETDQTATASSSAPKQRQEKAEPPARQPLPQPAGAYNPGGDLAKAKLLERLNANQQSSDRFGGRGRGGGRRGRRGRFDDDDDDGTSMTLEEYEAMQKAKLSNPFGGASASAATMTDEQLARKLQEELDLEDRQAARGAGGSANSDLQQSLLGMFSYDRQEEDSHGGGRGRGRGGGRGRSSGGRGGDGGGRRGGRSSGGGGRRGGRGRH